MWSYYGSKSKIIDLYPRPKHDKIIEPFAGSARYALKYFDRDVLLVDKYEVIVRLWRWLQQCSPKDILGLPKINSGESLDSFTFDIPEQKLLMGFMVQQGVAAPRKTVSPTGNFGKCVERDKKRIAKNLFKIKHWDVLNSSFDKIPNENATWFIDPPYEYGGHEYKHSNKALDFKSLAKWCRDRNGQSIVCENTKATWMQFVPLKQMHGSRFSTTEAIWTNEPTSYASEQLSLF